MVFIIKRVSVWCVVLCALCLPLVADDVVVPVDVQIALFVKIWKFDRTFKPGATVEVAVLYQQKYRPSATAATQLVSAVQAAKLPIHCTLINLEEQGTLRDRVPISGVDLYYVTPLRAIDVRAIADISRTNRIRTITGVPEYVASGLAVGIGLLNQRPQIIVNLQAARAEGADFSTPLLKLSHVIADGGAAYADARLPGQ